MSGMASICGMYQDEEDDFDWTIQSGRTPSRHTGPNAARHGTFYAFIEASKPRVKGHVAKYVC